MAALIFIPAFILGIIFPGKIIHLVREDLDVAGEEAAVEKRAGQVKVGG